MISEVRMFGGMSHCTWFLHTHSCSKYLVKMTCSLLLIMVFNTLKYGLIVLCAPSAWNDVLKATMTILIQTAISRLMLSSSLMYSVVVSNSAEGHVGHEDEKVT